MTNEEIMASAEEYYRKLADDLELVKLSLERYIRSLRKEV